MNKSGLELINVTREDYLKWCRKYKKPNYKMETKKRFFKLIQNGEIVRDENNNLVIKKGE